MGLMLRTIGAALFAALLVGLPARAIETQPPAATPRVQSKTVTPSKSKTLAKGKVGSEIAGKHQQRPAKISTTTRAKAKQGLATKKSNQNATALQSTTKSKIAKSKAGKSNQAKLNQAKLNPSKSNRPKSGQVKSQQAKNRMPADSTGSVAPRSVPTPGLY
jgi:hypothetical protein